VSQHSEAIAVGRLPIAIVPIFSDYDKADVMAIVRVVYKLG